jgi:hypothetical protein
MKNIIPLFFLLLSCFPSAAQEEMKGTVKVKKNGKIFNVFFDNVNNRLVGKDYYGNILDSAIVSFDVKVIIKGIEIKESVTGNTLSGSMQNRINRADSGTTLFFTNVIVKEKKGKPFDWPNFNTKIGFVFEKEE